jgi:hypothetical protein
MVLMTRQGLAELLDILRAYRKGASEMTMAMVAAQAALAADSYERLGDGWVTLWPHETKSGECECHYMAPECFKISVKDCC